MALAAAVAGGALASRLPVLSDISYLLPPSELSVRHLRALEKRARVFATYQVGVESADGAARGRAAEWLRERFEAFDKDLVASVVFDDRALKRFAWQHRFLFAELTDLEAARDALRDALKAENPLLVSIAEEHRPSADDHRLRELQDKLARAERDANAPGGMVSADGLLQMILVRTTFTSDDLPRGQALTARLDALLAEAGRTFAGVAFGMTGDVIGAGAEQKALIQGMLLSTAITVALVFAALLYFYRSFLGVSALLSSLTVGTLLTFGFTRVAIGHLNLATAFLSSIVVGNGINFGIILLGRYFDERRRQSPPVEAFATAFSGTAHGTIAAALAAAASYVSLVITPFRGFRHFGIIGGAGMALCWLSAYTVLPAAVFALERVGWLRPGRASGLGPLLARVLPRRPRPVAVAATALLVAVAFGSWRYLTHSPLETNLNNLSSDKSETAAASDWMDKFDKKFGHGISGGFVIGVPRREDAPEVVRKLRAVDEGKPERQRLFSQIAGLDDLLPHDQPRKLALLAEIRRLIDRLAPKLDAGDRAAVERLRPPEGLAPVRDQDVPADIAWPFTERDGTRGRLILANVGLGIDSWNTHDLERFSRAVRGLGLAPDVLIGGTAFVFSDMLAAMERDGPRATALAAVGAVVVVLLAVGARVEGAITLFCGALGTLTLLTVASLVGLKVNFLDFIALPITIGIGIDYAVNIVARARHDPAALGSDRLFETSAAVLLCSFTTTVGYGSLLLSLNKGIRSFGLGAMLGEVTCLTTALLVAPALLRIVRRRG